jgi:hypothetical protein
VPVASHGYVYSTRIIEDGSYLRFKTAALGYTLSSKLLRNIKIKSCRFIWLRRTCLPGRNIPVPTPKYRSLFSAYTRLRLFGVPTCTHHNRRFEYFAVTNT